MRTRAYALVLVVPGSRDSGPALAGRARLRRVLPRDTDGQRRAADRHRGHRSSNRAVALEQGDDAVGSGRVRGLAFRVRVGVANPRRRARRRRRRRLRRRARSADDAGDPRTDGALPSHRLERVDEPGRRLVRERHSARGRLRRRHQYREPATEGVHVGRLRYRRRRDRRDRRRRDRHRHRAEHGRTVRGGAGARRRRGLESSDGCARTTTRSRPTSSRSSTPT